MFAHSGNTVCFCLSLTDRQRQKVKSSELKSLNGGSFFVNLSQDKIIFLSFLLSFNSHSLRRFEESHILWKDSRLIVKNLDQDESLSLELGSAYAHNWFYQHTISKVSIIFLTLLWSQKLFTISVKALGKKD